MLEITAFARARDYGEHFRSNYGPTSPCRRTRAGRAATRSSSAALDRFCDEWDHGDADHAHFDKEYLLAVARRR